MVEWCPKDNPIRAFLGALKTAATPTPLPVYRAALTDDGEINVNLTNE